VQAHNDFLQALAETGYPGFLLLLFALGWFYADRIRCLKALPGSEGIVGIGEMGALTAILAGGLSGFPFHIAVSSVVFVVLAGSLASRGEKGLFERVSLDRRKNLFLGIEGAGIGLLGLTLAASVLLQYQADLFTKQGMEMVARQDFPAAESLLVRALSCDGARGDARVQLGYALAMQHRWEPASRVIEASLSTFDDVSTHYYLGFIYRSLGKFLDSRREYLRAISYYPEGHPTRAMILGQLQALDRYVAQGYEKKTTLEGGSVR
jgi:tetratricopeptide (TPR) repeat protein